MDVVIYRENSNVVLEADGIKRYYELHAWEEDAQRWGDDFWDQRRFEEGETDD